MSEEYLIVDGYNVINSWPDLIKLKEESYDHARLKLLEVLMNYYGTVKKQIILVFDAHNVKGGLERKESYPGVEVIYTREGETADMLIERLAAEFAPRANVFVATSDWIEQSVILQKGAYRMSARELLTEIQRAFNLNMEYIKKEHLGLGSLHHTLPDNVKETLERWRRGQS